LLDGLLNQRRILPAARAGLRLHRLHRLLVRADRLLPLPEGLSLLLIGPLRIARAQHQQ